MPLRAALLLVLLSGCAAAPRYTPPVPPGDKEVARELEARRRAMLRGDRGRLVRVAQSYVGVPYQWGGKSRAGLDCSALTRAIYREAYGLELSGNSQQLYQLGSGVSAQGQLRPGDLVFFRISSQGPGISHVGVYLGKNRFAHASPSLGQVVIAPLSTPYFQARYAGARRLLR
ncbi:MAG: C40 family peptidase [Candidatus Handelsmanbacteria bacterium]|nr:C40 family peptidase [Candidatus Handelsmanbacteria bacterium]